MKKYFVFLLFLLPFPLVLESEYFTPPEIVDDNKTIWENIDQTEGDFNEVTVYSTWRYDSTMKILSCVRRNRLFRTLGNETCTDLIVSNWFYWPFTSNIIDIKQQKFLREYRKTDRIFQYY